MFWKSQYTAIKGISRVVWSFIVVAFVCGWNRAVPAIAGTAMDWLRFFVLQTVFERPVLVNVVAVHPIAVRTIRSAPFANG